LSQMDLGLVVAVAALLALGVSDIPED
jgi:hypothetical protein